MKHNKNTKYETIKRTQLKVIVQNVVARFVQNVPLHFGLQLSLLTT